MTGADHTGLAAGADGSPRPGWKTPAVRTLVATAGAIAVLTFGAPLWIPALGFALAVWTLSKLAVEPRLIPTLSMTFAYGGAYAFNMLTVHRREGMSDRFWDMATEVGLVTILIGVVLFRRSRGSLWILLAYQALSLALAAASIINAPPRVSHLSQMAMLIFGIVATVHALRRDPPAAG